MGLINESNVVKTQMYWNGEAFDIECPLCFGRCYCYSENNIVCEEHPEHRFSYLTGYHYPNDL